MALPPHPEKEAEKGLKTGAEAVASVLLGVYSTAVSAIQKLFAGGASSSPIDSENSEKIPKASSPEPNPLPASLKLDIFNKAKEMGKAKEQMTEPMNTTLPRPLLPSGELGKKGEKQGSHAEETKDAEQELRAQKFTKDIIELNKLPPTTTKRKR